MPIEFQELENKYKSSSRKFQDLKTKAKEIVEKDALLKSYEAQLEAYSDESLDAVSSLLTEEQLQKFQEKREKIIAEIEKLRNEDLATKKEELTQARTEMDEYVKQAETNPEFKEAVYTGIMDKATHGMQNYRKLKEAPQASMLLIERLKEKAKTDKSLAKTLEFINQDKSDIATYKATIELMKADGQNTDEIQKSLDKKTNLLKNSGNKLKGYIKAHKDQLGLSDEDIDFTNSNSRASFINEFISPDSQKTLDDFENAFKAEADDYDKKIKHHRKIYEYAKNDLEELKNPEQEEVQVKVWKQIIQGIANLFKKCTNYVNTGKFELPDSTPEVQVVNTTGDWKDAYKTKIGEAKMAEIRKNYEKRIKNAERHNSGPDGR